MARRYSTGSFVALLFLLVDLLGALDYRSYPNAQREYPPEYHTFAHRCGQTSPTGPYLPSYRGLEIVQYFA